MDCDLAQGNFYSLALLRFASRFTVIKGDFLLTNMPTYQDQTWIRLWKENSPEIRERIVGWRKQNAVTRIDKPSRFAASQKIRV